MKRYLAIIFAALFFLASVDALARPILTAQKVVYRGTVTGLRVSAVDGTAFIDGANASITALADGNHSLEIYDTAGRFVRGVLKAAGTAETLGANLLASLTNSGDFPYDTAFVVNGDGINLTSAITGGSGLAYYNSALSLSGKLMKFTANAVVTTGGFAPFRTSLNNTGGLPTITYATVNSTQAVSAYATETSGNRYFNFQSTAASNLSFSAAVFSQVLTPSTFGATIVTAKAGTVFNFGYKGAAFTYNAASYFCVVRRLR